MQQASTHNGAGATRAARPTKKSANRAPLISRLYAAVAAPLGFTVAGAAVAAGWAYREARDLSAETGLGYALGLIAVGCMLILLVYPLRKRLKILRFIGPIPKWFRVHMMLGVLGPLAALYHCNFQLGSLNSQVALFSALLVAGSGLVGRLLYRKIHQGLYGRKTDLNQLRGKAQLTPTAGGRALSFFPQLTQRLRAFDEQVLDSNTGISASLALLFRISVRTRLEYSALTRFIRKQVALEARRSTVIARHERRLYKSARRYVAEHLFRVRRVAQLQAYERLFALWHVVHLPFFVLLVISTIVHVFAVHLY